MQCICTAAHSLQSPVSGTDCVIMQACVAELCFVNAVLLYAIVMWQATAESA